MTLVVTQQCQAGQQPEQAGSELAQCQNWHTIDLISVYPALIVFRDFSARLTSYLHYGSSLIAVVLDEMAKLEATVDLDGVAHAIFPIQSLHPTGRQ